MTRDPDLDQAIEELHFPARRVRQLQAQVAQADEVEDYRNLTARKFELAELIEAFALRGEKLKIADDRRLAGRALLIATEEAGRLRDRQKRRPSFDQLHRAMQDRDRACQINANEAITEAAFAVFARKVAVQNAAATSAAVTYMEASR